MSTATIRIDTDEIAPIDILNTNALFSPVSIYNSGGVLMNDSQQLKHTLKTNVSRFVGQPAEIDRRIEDETLSINLKYSCHTFLLVHDVNETLLEISIATEPVETPVQYAPSTDEIQRFPVILYLPQDLTEPESLEVQSIPVESSIDDRQINHLYLPS